MAGYDGFAVPRYDKTGISCHETNVMAGYCGSAVVAYLKNGKSCRKLGKLAGFYGYAVPPNDKTRISCHITQNAFKGHANETASRMPTHNRDASAASEPSRPGTRSPSGWGTCARTISAAGCRCKLHPSCERGLSERAYAPPRGADNPH